MKQKNSKSFAVIGAGRFGAELAIKLREHDDISVMVIDKDEDKINNIADLVDIAVSADSTDKDVLKNLGVHQCDVVVMAHAIDLSASVLTTMHLKNLGAKHVICKARDKTHKEVLEKLGADRVIIPEHDVADKLALNLTKPNAMELISISTDFGILEVPVPESWADKTVIEIAMRKDYGVNLIAIKQKDNSMMIDIRPETILHADEVLVLFGSYDKLNGIDDF